MWRLQKHILIEARRILAGALRTPEIEREVAALAQVEAYTESGEWMKFLRRAPST
jgi:hypothetical protein